MKDERVLFLIFHTGFFASIYLVLFNNIIVFIFGKQIKCQHFNRPDLNEYNMKPVISTLMFTVLYGAFSLILNPHPKFVPFLIGMFVASAFVFLGFSIIIRSRNKEMKKGAGQFDEKVLCSDLITYRKGILNVGGFCYLLENKVVFKTGVFRSNNVSTLPLDEITSVTIRNRGFGARSVTVLSKNCDTISFVVNKKSGILAAINRSRKN